MKTILLGLLVTMAFSTLTHAADVTVYDSVVTLATNGTKNYTFTDSASGQSAVLAVTMSPYSTDPAAVFSILDGNTRVGVGNPNISGDGNLIAFGEGVNFSATLVSSSSGVTASSISFRIAGLGLRAVDGTPAQTWVSTATASNPFTITGETLNVLDSSTVLISGSSYSGQLRFVSNVADDYQLSDVGALAEQSVVLNVTFSATATNDVRTSSWLTTYSGKYARIYTTDANKTAGNSVTTWSNGTQTQSSPTYSGVQEIYSSTNWVYIRSTGLGAHVMGPWYLNAAHTTAFPNYPVNTKSFYRIPRTSSVPATKTLTALGAIGYFVDGVAMFDSRDGFVWTGSTESGSGTGYWNREAYVNESVTFDPGYAHQENTGTHHYHADPIALRYLLGDHVDFNAATKIYSESASAVTKHSPILGWVRDGYPVYGPYGYSTATNSASGVRRMVSGYVLRNGSNGTQNLAAVGRTNIPQWAVRVYNVAATQSGPTVSPSYPLGRYMEDNDYLGDLGKTQGVDFDLDEYNGRFCVTPEFPGGTYAYFVSISASGTPTFPYNIGRAFYGNPTGAAVTSISETVTTNFLGNTNLSSQVARPSLNSGTVTLVWSSVEGGTYRVESSTSLPTWTSKVASVAAQGITTQTNFTGSGNAEFYRVSRTAVANFDSAGTTTITGGGGNSVAPGGSASRGSTVTITITLPTSPPQPPANMVPASVTLAGTISGTAISRPDVGTVVATFVIPANASTGAQNIAVTFSPAPAYNMTGVFTIN